MIAIRTSYGIDSGLGHLMRMRKLAEALRVIGKDVVFLVNSKNKNSEKYLNDFTVVGLYKTNINISSFDQANDALLCIEFLKDTKNDMVVLDSYNIGIEWENILVNYGFKLTVFDDIQRQHNCDYLVDSKWQGNDTYSRYKRLIPERCKPLLGPSFLMVDKVCKNNFKNDKFIIMLSLGGGGDLMLFRDLLKELALINIENVVLMPIIGDYATNKESFIEITKKYKNIKLVIGATDLSEYYKKTSLFIGALGTMFYESRMFGIPAITFSIAENQENKISDLEDFGHYFHLPLCEFKQANKVAKLIIIFIKKYKKVKKITTNPEIVIDGYGAKRVAQAITNGENLPHKLKKDEASSTNNSEIVYVNKELIVRKIDNNDVNNYLLARNLPINSKNMLSFKKILFIDHYLWWFSNKRYSYVVTKDHKDKIYIWHEEIFFKGQSYLVGGWFSAVKDKAFDVAFSALEWQLNYTSKKFPESVWIAIIKKNNKYVNLLNSYLGFVSVDSNSVEFNAIEHYFGKASSEYNYVKK